MTIHHATLARAEKMGVVVTENDKTDEIQMHWAARNRRAWAPNAAYAPRLLDDFKTVRMIVLEYPTLTVKQDHKDYVWSISMRGDVLATASIGKLDEAWDEAFEILQTDEAESVETEPSEDSSNGLAEDATEEEAEDSDSGSHSIIKNKYKSAYKPFKMSNGDEVAHQLAEFLKAKGEDGKLRIDADRLERFARNNGLWDERYARLNVGMRRLNVGNKLRAKLRKNPEWVVDWNK